MTLQLRAEHFVPLVSNKREIQPSVQHHLVELESSFATPVSLQFHIYRNVTQPIDLM